MNRFIYLACLFFLFSSCEKVIDVDLNEVNPAIVIEGDLCFSEELVKVMISKTGSYFGGDSLQKVGGATVYLEDQVLNKRTSIEETAQGVYMKNGVVTHPGHVYTLFVELEDITYSASSALSPAVPIDSLSYEDYKGAAFFEKGYRLFLYFSDPPEKKNYYRIKLYNNGLLLNGVNDLIVFDDRGIAGKAIQVRLRGQIFEEGDTARVEFLSLDEDVYEYFASLRALNNINPGSPAPANPPSNFSNGALGYFSAWSHDSKTIIIGK